MTQRIVVIITLALLLLWNYFDTEKELTIKKTDKENSEEFAAIISETYYHETQLIAPIFK